VPVSKGDQIQTMSAFMVAGSDPGKYGQLTVFQTPPIDGPALVDADIAATQAISSKISLLNQNGSSVELGTLQVVPVGDSMLYFRPFYVESSRNPFPELDYYVVVYAGAQGQSQVAFDTTLSAALNDLFNVSLPGQSTSSTPSTPSGPTSVSQRVQGLITQANADFQQAQTDLKNGNFAAYGTDITSLQGVLQQLQQASGSSSSSSSSSSTKSPTSTSTTTTKSSKSTTTTTKSSKSTTTTTKASGVALREGQGR